MARKVNLKALFDNGDLTPSLYVGSEDAASDGLGVLFDGDENTFKLVVNQTGGTEQLRLNFFPILQCKKIRLKIVTKITDGYNIYLNSNFSNIAAGISGLGSSTDIKTNNFDFNVNGLEEIAITLGTSFGNGDHEIYEIQLFILEEADPYEFNDSVLTTKGWNSSRYDGRQLQGAVINEFTNGDTTYGNTPVIQNYTRNIYIGSRIIGMESGSIEDSTLLNFPGFSYITVDEYLTVNDDLSVTRTFIKDVNPIKGKKQFYQSWYQDFPVGSRVEVQPLDKKLEQSLKPSYEIYNNSGQLQKLLLIHQSGSLTDHKYAVMYQPNYVSDPFGEYDTLTWATGSNVNTGATFFMFNKELLIDEWFSGSLIDDFTIAAQEDDQGSGGK